MKRSAQIEFMKNAPKRSSNQFKKLSAKPEVKEVLRKYDYLLDRHQPQAANGH